MSKTLFGGSSSKSKSGLDPRFFDLYNENQQYGKGVANNLQTRQMAGFSDLQNQGFNALSQANNNEGMQASAAGLRGLGGMQNFSPERIGMTGANATGYGVGSLGPAAQSSAANIDRKSIRDVNGGSFLSGNIGAYQNPYQREVIDQSMMDIDRQRQLTGQGNAAQAIGQKAFGGSRSAIQAAENDRNYADTFARTSAGLRSQGFDTAAGLMQNDMSRGLQAQGMNQGQDANVAGQNAAFGQQNNLSNADAQNRFALSFFGAQNDANQFGATASNNASLFNAGQSNDIASQNAANGISGANLRMNAMNGLMNGGQAYNQSFLGNINAQLQGGGMQQQLEQDRLDAARNLEQERLAIRSGAIGLNPGGGAGMTGSASGSASNGAGSFLGSLFGKK